MKDKVETVRKILTGLGVVISGVGLATAFPPFDQTINSWSCLVPLLWIIRSAPRKRAVWCAFFTGVIFWLVSLCWLPAIIKNGGPWALVVLGMVGLSAACSAYWALFAWLSSTFWQRAKRYPFSRLLCVLLVDPILWAGTEYLRGTLFSGFAWNFLGVSQVQNIPFIQVSSLFGVYAVSALLVLVNGAVTSICQRLVVPLWNRLSPVKDGFENLRRPPFPVRLCQSLESILPFLLVFGAWFWGNARIHGVQSDGEVESIRVAVIQPNIPCVFSCTPEQMRLLQIERVLDQTKMAGLAKPDLIVWPESAVPGMVPQNSYSMEFLRLGSVASQGTVLAGVSEMREKSEDENLYYNSAWLISSEGKECGIYRKQHLVPFGEYVPFDKAIPWLQRLVPIGVSCTPGDSASVMELPTKPGVRIGALICFEDTVPPLSRAAVKEGSNLLALLTNDAWFNQSCEPLQHQMQAVFRSVENCVPMVRSANSGVSCFVDRFGRVKRLELEGKIADFHGFLLGVTEPNGGGTFYTRTGDIPLIAAFSILAILAFVFRLREHSVPIRPKHEKFTEKERRWRMLHPDHPPQPTDSPKPADENAPIAVGMTLQGRLVRDANERYARVEVDGISNYRFRVDWSEVMRTSGFANPLQGKEAIEQVLPLFYGKDYLFQVTEVDSALYRATVVCPELSHDVSNACIRHEANEPAKGGSGE
ncbi:MAG: apolipoprotein N-acyltransferase [Kiritimatiellae bacterium]|nr:apolipoprotein N-acyltransferase [Kiritimatiellia bacterium]